jgi:hypothetical protein
MQDPKSGKDQPISAYEAARRRRNFAVREILGLRRLRMVTVDAETTSEEQKPDPGDATSRR